VFGERLKPDEYLARYKTPDLFLDTFPYNAGTTASDALWVGLPVLTFCGAAFASRMAASALMGVGMPELITHSVDDYVKKAIELGLQPATLHQLKQTLTKKKPEAALFDTPRFARHLENIYQTVVERAASGQSPQNTDTF
jgi:predicted O-linked N-acetylglucosamine transferase (SPINDLY family)